MILPRAELQHDTHYTTPLYTRDDCAIEAARAHLKLFDRASAQQDSGEERNSSGTAHLQLRKLLALPPHEFSAAVRTANIFAAKSSAAASEQVNSPTASFGPSNSAITSFSSADRVTCVEENVIPRGITSPQPEKNGQAGYASLSNQPTCPQSRHAQDGEGEGHGDLLSSVHHTTAPICVAKASIATTTITGTPSTAINTCAASEGEGFQVISSALVSCSAYRGSTSCPNRARAPARRRLCLVQELAPLSRLPEIPTCTKLSASSASNTRAAPPNGSCASPSARPAASNTGYPADTLRAVLMRSRSPLRCAPSSPNSNSGCSNSNSNSEFSRGGAAVARLAHNQEVVGSIPTPATKCRSESNNDRPRDQRATGPAPALRVGELPAQAACASGQPARIVSFGGWHPRWVHGPENRATAMSRDGSIPSPSANQCPASSAVERLLCKQWVGGSNPSLGSITFNSNGGRTRLRPVREIERNLPYLSSRGGNRAVQSIRIDRRQGVASLIAPGEDEHVVRHVFTAADLQFTRPEMNSLRAIIGVGHLRYCASVEFRRGRASSRGDVEGHISQCGRVSSVTATAMVVDDLGLHLRLDLAGAEPGPRETLRRDACKALIPGGESERMVTCASHRAEIHSPSHPEDSKSASAFVGFQKDRLRPGSGRVHADVQGDHERAYQFNSLCSPDCRSADYCWYFGCPFMRGGKQ